MLESTFIFALLTFKELFICCSKVGNDQESLPTPSVDPDQGVATCNIHKILKEGVLMWESEELQEATEFSFTLKCSLHCMFP